MGQIMLIGTHECKLDAKGRLPIPAALKKQLAPVLADGFVLKRSVFQPCLELYSMNEWNMVMQKINRLNRFVKKNNDFIRLFTAGVKVLEADGNQRLQISKDLMGFSGMEKEVVMSAAGSYIEIWDKAKYEAVLNSETDFGQLAEEVMSKMGWDELS